jgi:hypothetical protein
MISGNCQEFVSSGQFVSVIEERGRKVEIEVPLTLIAAAATQPEWQLSH